MRNTHEPQAALKALIAALGVSTMLMASAPAHAGPLGFLKRAAEQELKKAAEERLAAEADKGGVLGLAAGAAMDRAGMEPTANSGNEGGGLWNDAGTSAAAEHEVEYDVASQAYKAGTASAANGDGFADIVTSSGTGAPRVRVIDGTRVQDTFLYFDAETAAEKGKGKVEATWKVEEGEAAATGDDHRDWIIIESMSGFTGGVFVASGDVNSDGRDDIIVGPGLCKLVQNGTTVATAEDILSNLSDEEEALWAKAKKTHNMTATCAKLVQNGTTVATASEIQAQHAEQGILIGLLLPAVQNVREAAPRPTRAGMSQNGTTVPSADTVQAPKTERTISLLLPAVQNVRAAAKPERAGMSQNGTTVPSADTVKSPEDDERMASPYLHIEGVKGESKD